MKSAFPLLVLAALIVAISIGVPLASIGPRSSLHVMGGSTFVVAIGGWAAFTHRRVSTRREAVVWVSSLATSIAAAIASQAESAFVVLGIVHAVGVAIVVAAVLLLGKWPSRFALSCPGVFLVSAVNWVVLCVE